MSTHVCSEFTHVGEPFIRLLTLAMATVADDDRSLNFRDEIGLVECTTSSLEGSKVVETQTEESSRRVIGPTTDRSTNPAHRARRLSGPRARPLGPLPDRSRPVRRESESRFRHLPHRSVVSEHGLQPPQRRLHLGMALGRILHRFLWTRVRTIRRTAYHRSGGLRLFQSVRMLVLQVEPNWRGFSERVQMRGHGWRECDHPQS